MTKTLINNRKFKVEPPAHRNHITVHPNLKTDNSVIDLVRRLHDRNSRVRKITLNRLILKLDENEGARRSYG